MTGYFDEWCEMIVFLGSDFVLKLSAFGWCKFMDEILDFFGHGSMLESI